MFWTLAQEETGREIAARSGKSKDFLDLVDPDYLPGCARQLDGVQARMPAIRGVNIATIIDVHVLGYEAGTDQGFKLRFTLTSSGRFEEMIPRRGLRIRVDCRRKFSSRGARFPVAWHPPQLR